MDRPAAAERFLRPRLAHLPSPTSMAGMKEAVARLARAVRDRERIAVFGDYDADGITSSALALTCLRQLGLDARCWLADRFDHGYGLSPGAVEQIAGDGRSLLLVLDCGTSDHEALALARERGVDAVVVDHHPPSGKLPQAEALVNPLQERCEFPDKGMATVGLAFYLMGALRTELSAPIDVRKLLDLVAVGTVADVAPLEGVNRILVRRGLERLDRAPRPGLASLCAVSGVKRPTTARAIGFRLGPRINAAGRLGKPEAALDLLMADDSHTSLRLAQTLDQYSKERRAIQDRVTGVALPQAREQAGAGRAMILVGQEGWHQGVVGIVASRLCEEVNLPAAVVSFEGEIGRGSARSPAGLDLHEVLLACAEQLERFGGHAAAAGFMVRRDRFDELHQAMDRAVRQQLQGRELPNEIQVDVRAADQDLSLRTVEDLAQLGPFGQANPEPVLLLEKVQGTNLRQVGDGHLSLGIVCGLATIKAFWPQAAGRWPSGADRVDVLGSLRLDAFRGREQVELLILDVRPA